MKGRLHCWNYCPLLFSNCMVKFKKSQYTVGYCIQLKDSILDHCILDTFKCHFTVNPPTVF